jgi:hypothetical protein
LIHQFSALRPEEIDSKLLEALKMRIFCEIKKEEIVSQPERYENFRQERIISYFRNNDVNSVSIEGSNGRSDFLSTIYLKITTHFMQVKTSQILILLFHLNQNKFLFRVIYSEVILQVGQMGTLFQIGSLRVQMIKSIGL